MCSKACTICRVVECPMVPMVGGIGQVAPGEGALAGGHSLQVRDAPVRDLPPRLLETRLHPLPLDHDHLPPSPGCKVPQVPGPGTEEPRAAEAPATILATS